MKPVVRFAPSPTGNIHIGNARTALMNWVYARKSGGSFILRFDDTDRERSKAEYADQIEKDLHWLGIEPDRVDRQSARIDIHQAATDRLKEAGLLYPCYETPEELEKQRKRLAMRGKPPVYDRSALKLTDAERAQLEAAANGVPLGAYIKALLFDGDLTKVRRRNTKPVEDHKALARVLAALGQSRLSANLNQLAHAVNTGTLPVLPDTENDIRQACKEVLAIRADLLRALAALIRQEELRRKSRRNSFLEANNEMPF